MPIDIPYDTIIVDTVSGFDAKAVKPIVYVHVSRVTRVMSVVPVMASRNWTRERRYDRVRRIHDVFYESVASDMLPLDWLVDVCLKLEELPNQVSRNAFLAERGLQPY